MPNKWHDPAASSPNYWQPFKKLTSTHKYLKPIKEFNINPMPSTLSFRTDIFRQFGERKIRDIGDDGLLIEPTFDKYFTWDRFYDYKHNLTRSISFDYSAVVNTRIDEPEGRIDTEEKKDSLRQSFWSFGRKVNYEHRFNASYNVPLKNIPFLDWMTSRIRYNSTYGWTASSLACANSISRSSAALRLVSASFAAVIFAAKAAASRDHLQRGHVPWLSVEICGQAVVQYCPFSP